METKYCDIKYVKTYDVDQILVCNGFFLAGNSLYNIKWKHKCAMCANEYFSRELLYPNCSCNRIHSDEAICRICYVYHIDQHIPGPTYEPVNRCKTCGIGLCEYLYSKQETDEEDLLCRPCDLTNSMMNANKR
jgi:hypothetical protein